MRDHLILLVVSKGTLWASRNDWDACGIQSIPDDLPGATRSGWYTCTVIIQWKMSFESLISLRYKASKVQTVSSRMLG